ncbi:uncharacterized protein C8Q71DRAFT_762745 [Rhodofomes roseus]|uniref:Uncharacterized protein n=1 Tax=Rhodofomes roseus TaxID=34475 RepID=A0ABQ8KE56_9APHY|nr:uncharacterized protein C8Q71DRAFT_762745 [Rhodofomes roseus]KAH9835603.1 hypothetical protein C8Q71DRAFT_762745 [Rhodofomes roseus]
MTVSHRHHFPCISCVLRFAEACFVCPVPHHPNSRLPPQDVAPVIDIVRPFSPEPAHVPRHAMWSDKPHLYRPYPPLRPRCGPMRAMPPMDPDSRTMAASWPPLSDSTTTRDPSFVYLDESTRSALEPSLGPLGPAISHRASDADIAGYNHVQEHDTEETILVPMHDAQSPVQVDVCSGV